MKKLIAFTLSIILLFVAMALPVSAQTTDTNETDVNNTTIVSTNDETSIDEATFDEVTADEFSVTVTADYSKHITISWNEIADADYYILTIESEDHEYYFINESVDGNEYKWSPLFDCCYFYINVESYNSEDELITTSGNIVVDVDAAGVWDDYTMYGDVDYNHNVNIKDATLIQKSLAELECLYKKQIEAADTDQDGEVTIKDATDIQKYVAGIELPNSSVGNETAEFGLFYNATIVK